MLKAAEVVAELCAELAAAGDQEGAFPVEEFKALAAAGLLRATLPRSDGGTGIGVEPGSTWSLLRLLKHTGRGNLAVGRVYEGHVNALQLINTFGTPGQRERYARDARDAGKLFGVWNTEAADGVHLHPLPDGGYQLEGFKTFTSGAGHVARPIVTGRLPDAAGGGWQMCVVPMDEVATHIDTSWWRPLGMRASASFRVDFGGVRVSPDALLGAPDDYYRQPWFGAGAIRFAAVQLGGAEALFDHTRRYLRDLDRAADPHQRARAGEVAILIEGGNNWLRGAALQADTLLRATTGEMDGAGDNGNNNHADTRAARNERVVAYANMTRTAIESICLECMRLCERSVGARGLLRPHPLERIHRDLTLYLRQPATDAALNDAGRYALEHDAPAHALWDEDAPEAGDNV